MLVGISRHGQAPRQPLAELRLEPGDAAIVEVNEAFFYENRRETDFTLTRRLEGYRVQRVDRALIATAITATMVTVAAFGMMSMLNAALLATAAMLLTGCLTSSRVWRSLDWQTIVVMGAAVGLESAVTDSGLSEALAKFIAGIGGNKSDPSAQRNLCGNDPDDEHHYERSRGRIHVPRGFVPGEQPGSEFHAVRDDTDECRPPLHLINPAAFQTNLMVQGPGGYTFGDFARVGVPLTIIVGAVVLSLAPFVYGF